MISEALSQGLTWKLTRGISPVDIGKDELHILPGNAKEGPFSMAEASLGLQRTAVWRVSFEMRFGDLASLGTGLVLESAGHPVATLSSDASLSRMSAFVGEGNTFFGRHIDGEWHRCEIYGTQEKATWWLDGQKISEDTIPGIPDRVKMGVLRAAAGQQGEMAIRGLAVWPTPITTGWVDLLSRQDLNGWFSGLAPWEVTDGVLRNSHGKARDWLDARFPLPTTPIGEFALKMHLRILDGTRMRVLLVPDPIRDGNESNFYIGNEGFEPWIQMYGKDLQGVTMHGDPHYKRNEWMTIELRVDAQNHVTLTKDGVLTQSATLLHHKPLRITLLAGDDWSEGHVEVDTLQLWMPPSG